MINQEFYLRLNRDTNGLTEALPYLIEDMDNNEKYEFLEQLKNKYNELKMEGEL